MQLRYRYRLYPDSGQQQALAQAFGNARVVYNDAVRARQNAHKAGQMFPAGTVLQKRLIPGAAGPTGPVRGRASLSLSHA